MKYSIIIPTKNGGTYLKECVQSILAQTYEAFNIHILEHDSTDGTKEWLSTLKDPRIKLEPPAEGLGIVENWHRVLAIDKNEYMTIIGYDDLLHPGYLEAMDALIDRHPKASLYQAHFNYINATAGFVRPCLPMDEVQYAHEFLACHFCRTIDSTATGYMMRSRDYHAVGGIPTRYPNLIFADYDLWIRLSHLGYKATDIQTTFSYRLHESVSKITNGMQYQQAFQEYMRLVIALMNKDEKVKEVVKRYGKAMLLYYCESLSHRLLKTPQGKRNIKVADYIKICEAIAADLIPGQEFNPMQNARIRLARDLDTNSFTRGLFQLYRKYR